MNHLATLEGEGGRTPGRDLDRPSLHYGIPPFGDDSAVCYHTLLGCPTLNWFGVQGSGRRVRRLRRAQSSRPKADVRSLKCCRPGRGFLPSMRHLACVGWRPAAEANGWRLPLASPPRTDIIRRRKNSTGCSFCCNSAFGPSLLGSRGDPIRRLTARVPPCSRSVQRKSGRVAEAEARPPAGEFRNQNFPINGALILRGRAGEVSDRTRRAGEPRCPMFEMLRTEEGVFQGRSSKEPTS